MVWYFKRRMKKPCAKHWKKVRFPYYTGYDPTADSLHLGHLVAILTSRRLQLAGHKPYALVGGATGLIGDPSFKDAERSLQTKETVQEWVRSIQGQLSRFLDFENGYNKPKWSTTTIGSEALALLTSFVMSGNTLRSML